MRQRWQDWAGLVLGGWMFFSPWILGYSASAVATGNALILGLAVAVFFIVALANPRIWEEWINLALAAWIFIAPFVLQFTSVGAAAWNHWIVAVLIGIDAIWAMSETLPREQHHAA